MAIHEDGRWVCEACGLRYDAPGFCDTHAGEPLLDLTNEDVLITLDELYTTKWRTRVAIYTALVAPFGIVLGAPGCLFGRYGMAVGGMAMGFGILGGSALLIKLWPPKKTSPDLSEQDRWVLKEMFPDP